MQSPRPGRADRPRVLVFPPALYAAALLAGLSLEYVARTSTGSLGLRLALGGPLVVLGGFLMGAGFLTFRSAGTHVEVYRPATTLVTGGLFRYSRNPIYIGATLTYAGIGVLADSLWVLALTVPVVVIMHYGVVLREEEYLAATFGEAYRDYARRVRRWL